MRRRLARLVERDVDDILDRVMEAFVAHLPKMKSFDRATTDAVRDQTRRAITALLALYADPLTPARPILTEALRPPRRDGAPFGRDEIAAMVQVARAVIFESARERASAELRDEDPTEVREALDGLLDELERADRELAEHADKVQYLLEQAEREGPDIR